MNISNSNAAATGTRMITAYFDTRPAAEQARTDVLATGLSGEAVKITDGYGTVTGNAQAEGSTEGRSLLQSLKSTFSPEHPSEGATTRKGGFLVTAHATADKYEDVRRILEGAGTVTRDAG